MPQSREKSRLNGAGGSVTQVSKEPKHESGRSRMTESHGMLGLEVTETNRHWVVRSGDPRCVQARERTKEITFGARRQVCPVRPRRRTPDSEGETFWRVPEGPSPPRTSGASALSSPASTPVWSRLTPDDAGRVAHVRRRVHCPSRRLRGVPATADTCRTNAVAWSQGCVWSVFELLGRVSVRGRLGRAFGGRRGRPRDLQHGTAVVDIGCRKVALTCSQS